jgi:hypothetical protein
MNSRRAPIFLKLLPSLADFAFLAPLVFLFGRLEGLKVLLSDCDTGWHIRTGQWILANRAVPARDIFSFSKPGEPWFAWEWLSDVVFALLNAAGGLKGIAIFSVVLLSLTSLLLFRLLRRKANLIVAFLIAIWAMVTTSIHWLARPHLFTLLFVVLFCSALERMREGRTRLAGIPYLILLPAATLLWTNLHGAFFVGILIVAAYGAGEFLPGLLLSSQGGLAAAWRNSRPYVLTAGACLAASFLNPYTYHLHVHLATYLRDPYMAEHISEFLTLSFRHPMATLFEGMLLLGVAVVCWSVLQGRFVEAAVLVGCGHAALLAGRNIPIFMIAAAPLVAGSVEEWLDRLPASRAAAWLRNAIARFNGVAARTAAMEAAGRWHLAGAAGLIVVAALICAPNPPARFRAEFDPARHPAGALATLRSLPAARIFTYDQWGGYLIWSLYPSQRVFVDGRTDFYGTEFDRQYLEVLYVRQDWDKILDRYGIDTVLMPPGTALTGALKESSRWRVVYDDGVAVVFRAVRPAAATVSVADAGGGERRDRKVAATQVSDRKITDHNPTT